MGIRREEGLDEVPADMDGFVLAQTNCEHGEPHVLMAIYKHGELLAGRVMDVEELTDLAASFVMEARKCEERRQLKQHADRVWRGEQPTGPAVWINGQRHDPDTVPERSDVEGDL